MRWLPRWCMKEKPCSRRSRLTSVAESGRSSGKGQFEGLDAPAQLQPALDLFRAGGFQPKFHRFRQHGVRFLASLALAGNAEFGTDRNIPGAFPFDHSRQRRQFDHFSASFDPAWFHGVTLQSFPFVRNSQSQLLESVLHFLEMEVERAEGFELGFLEMFRRRGVRFKVSAPPFCRFAKCKWACRTSAQAWQHDSTRDQQELRNLGRHFPFIDFIRVDSCPFAWLEFPPPHVGGYRPSLLNRLFTSLKWKSSVQKFSSSPGLKCFATSGSDLSCSTKSASSRPACFTSQVFIALRWTSSYASSRVRPFRMRASRTVWLFHKPRLARRFFFMFSG